MEKIKNLWREFMYERTKFDAAWDISCFFAAVASVVLMFFLPVTTFMQWAIVVASVGIGVIFLFPMMFFGFIDYAEEYYNENKFWGWCALASVILWMFPISIFWSLIPIGIGLIVSHSIEAGELKIGLPIWWVILLGMLFMTTQNNIDAKRYLMTNPEPEVVVLSNYDRGQDVFFVEGEDTYLKFYNLRTADEAYNLDLKKGDTVKIVRHPNMPKKVIEITR